jgi:hypothetical protein
MRKWTGILIAITCLAVSEKSHAAIVNLSDITGVACIAAVKTSSTSSIGGPNLHVIDLYAEHWHEIAGNALAGFHTLSDYDDETNFLSLIDTFGSISGVLKIKMRTEHVYSWCLSGGQIKEVERVTWDEKVC